MATGTTTKKNAKPDALSEAEQDIKTNNTVFEVKNTSAAAESDRAAEDALNKKRDVPTETPAEEKAKDAVPPETHDAQGKLKLTYAAKALMVKLIEQKFTDGSKPRSGADIQELLDLPKKPSEMAEFMELRTTGVVSSVGNKVAMKYWVAKPIDEISEVAAASVSKGTRGPRKGATPSKKASGTSNQSNQGQSSHLVFDELPSPEQMNRLLRALENEEKSVNDSTSAENDKTISTLQKNFGTLKGDDLTRAFKELSKAMDERQNLTTRVRQDAFKNIEASELPEKRFLKFLKPSYTD